VDPESPSLIGSSCGMGQVRPAGQREGVAVCAGQRQERTFCSRIKALNFCRGKHARLVSSSCSGRWFTYTPQPCDCLEFPSYSEHLFQLAIQDVCRRHELFETL
jgi:hypothetical protein